MRTHRRARIHVDVASHDSPRWGSIGARTQTPVEIISADSMYFLRIKVTGLPSAPESQLVAGIPSDKMHQLACDTLAGVTRHPG